MRMDIKHTRQALGLTQAQLAETIGIHRVTIGKYEIGALEPTPCVILALEALTYRAEKAARKRSRNKNRAAVSAQQQEQSK